MVMKGLVSMKALGLILTLSLLLFTAVTKSYQARGWNGLIPLHSTRTDVIQRLGAGQGSCECVFSTPQETVFVEYAESQCKGPIYGWNSARRMRAETRLNSVPLVSWPLAAPFCAKCANFECLNLGGQSK